MAKDHPQDRHALCAIGLFIVAAAPLGWSRLFAAEYTLPKLLLLCLGLCLTAAGLLRSPGLARPTALDRPLLFFGLALSASFAFSMDPLLSLLGRYNAYENGLLALSLYAAVYFAASWCADEDNRKKLLRWSLWVASLASVYGVLQAFGLEPFTLSDDLPAGRVVSTLGSPVDLGAYLALLFPVALRSTPALIALSAGLIATGSRGAWLAAAAGTGLYLLLTGGRSRKVNAALLAAAVLLSLFAAVRLHSRPTSRSDRARLEAWSTGLRVFREHPWLGTGPDTFGLEFRRRKSPEFVAVLGPETHHAYAHNDVVEALATTGLFGTAAYLVVVVLWFRGAWKPAPALVGSLLALFLSMKFNPISFEVLAQGALLAGLALPAAREGGRRWAAPGFAVFALLSMSAVSWLSVADLHTQKGREALGRGQAQAALLEFKKALRLNPCELKYRILHINTLMDLIRPAPRSSPLLLSEALDSGREAERCHPKDFNGPYIRGYAALVNSQAGAKDSLPEAKDALDRALALDPVFPSLLRLRKEAGLP
ncbi:MAG: O-antigen ligase family protein [Elusimicrobiota bacterium]